ncbi:adenosine kinase [Emcibacter nanhaiensis]|uniref:Adenosine kinase n=1 Tax=Emcibacter nanhaiensis TaxID=1505037 RepID=A0A501PMZ1_9PROT|nr:adenosine kinase [Emcibacter nanhaiensis]TPD61870.1 adenosine kinase [Emcibacter nanhaiensis]
MTKKYEVVGIGNAIVDILTHVEDDFLAEHKLAKGSMQLFDEADAAKLYATLGQAIECSGGSAANTVAGLASLGHRTAFIGKVRDDQLGRIFRHDITALGTDFPAAHAEDGPATALCQVLVTPDAERTMCTYLGACVNLTEADIDDETIKGASITYLEGYLWDPEDAKNAFRKAIALAHEAGRKTSLSLSDPFCVDRHREEFLSLTRDDIDILFANEEELLMLFDTRDLATALAAAREHCEIAAVTRGAKGCVIAANGESIEVSGRQVSNLVDTTGAGDLFAAGFLHGYVTGEDLATCGSIGNLIASEVITHMGARPDIDLKAFLSQNMGTSEEDM